MITPTSFSLLRVTQTPVNNQPVMSEQVIKVFSGVLIPRGDIEAKTSAGVAVTVDAELFIDFRLDYKYSDQVLSLKSGDRWKFIRDFDYGEKMTFWMAKERTQ